MNLLKIIAWVGLFLVLGTWAEAQNLSNKALYYRCYSQLTQTFPEKDDDRTLQVASGSLNAIDACLQVFDAALFNSNLQVPNPSDDEAVAVLNTMHRLHSSWFQVKDFNDPGFGNTPTTGIKSIYDNTSPSFYFTRALFDKNTPFSYALTSKDHIRAIRATRNPATSLRVEKANTVFGTRTRFPDTGLLQGVRTEVMNWPYSYIVSTRADPQVTRTGTQNLSLHLGGGILGYQPYVLQTVEVTRRYRADGGVVMPRKWARSVLYDLMCRELPLVRRTDITSLIVADSEIPFRTTSSCVRCHATMDRMASTIRNFNYIALGGYSSKPQFGGFYFDMHAIDMPSESGWPAVSDKDYYRRPTRGTLFYRTHKGTLVDIPVKDPAELGQKMSEQDDPYICAAKRYYKYFLGVDVFIGDLGDPDTQPLSEADKKIRDEVIAFGLALKTHKDPRRMIGDILKSSNYQKSSFGLVAK